MKYPQFVLKLLAPISLLHIKIIYQIINNDKFTAYSERQTASPLQRGRSDYVLHVCAI